MSIVQPTKENIEKASTILQNGGMVSFATETVYGLGCDTLNTAAIKLVYESKGRPCNNPMIAHVFDVGGAKKLTTCWLHSCNKLTDAFWPGSLTLVLPRNETVPESACGGFSSVAIRCPAHSVARDLLTSFNGPISAPSANRSGYISPTTAKHVEDEFGKELLIIDGGACEDGIESTVLSLLDTPTILRPGSVTKNKLKM